MGKRWSPGIGLQVVFKEEGLKCSAVEEGLEHGPLLLYMVLNKTSQASMILSSVHLLLKRGPSVLTLSEKGHEACDETDRNVTWSSTE